jgi:hypothetical protein
MKPSRRPQPSRTITRPRCRQGENSKYEIRNNYKLEFPNFRSDAVKHRSFVFRVNKNQPYNHETGGLLSSIPLKPCPVPRYGNGIQGEGRLDTGFRRYGRDSNVGAGSLCPPRATTRVTPITENLATTGDCHHDTTGTPWRAPTSEEYNEGMVIRAVWLGRRVDL